MALMAIASSIFMTSCEDEWYSHNDREQSFVLSGQWYGDFGMYYIYVDNWGKEYEFDSYDTDIRFMPDHNGATYGYGTQVDYYEFGPYEYQYYQFQWRISGGYIYLTYPYDHNLDTRISQYRMTEDWFSGIFQGTNTSFRLRKIRDFYDWSPYTGNYGYYDRYNWSYGPYYIKAQRNAAGAQTTDTNAQEGIQARGRR